MSTASDVASLCLGQAAVRPSRATSVPGARSRLDRDEDRADRHLVCGADRRRRRATGSGRADGLRPHLPYLPWRCDALDPRTARDHASRRVALREERSVAPVPGARVGLSRRRAARHDAPPAGRRDGMSRQLRTVPTRPHLRSPLSGSSRGRRSRRRRRSSAAPISTTTPVAKMQPSTPARPDTRGPGARTSISPRAVEARHASPSTAGSTRPGTARTCSRRPGGRRASRSRRSPASAATAT